MITKQYNRQTRQAKTKEKLNYHVYIFTKIVIIERNYYIYFVP